MSAKRTSPKKSRNWLGLSIILLLVLFLIIMGSLFLLRHSITSGVSIAKKTFSDSYETAKTDTYQEYYNAAFEVAEAEHHVKNVVSINISGIKERSALEVLHVSDVVYIVEDGSGSPSGTVVWLKVPGSGVFTVDLTGAEFVVDNNRQHVLVRVSKPTLDMKNVTIDEENVETVYIKEYVLDPDNSIKSGEKLAREMLDQAKQSIIADFMSNEQYSKNAEAFAKSMLVTLVKGLNPDVENLQVDVEFC